MIFLLVVPRRTGTATARRSGIATARRSGTPVDRLPGTHYGAARYGTAIYS